MRIGELADITGTTAPTIRYYEEIGLLPLPSRAGDQRRYGTDDVRRLTFIRRCRDFGFPIDQVRVLASLTQDSERSCTHARDLAATHLAALRTKLQELRALEQSITDFIKASEEVCQGEPGADCRVLQALGEPPG